MVLEKCLRLWPVILWKKVSLNIKWCCRDILELEKDFFMLPVFWGFFFGMLPRIGLISVVSHRNYLEVDNIISTAVKFIHSHSNTLTVGTPILLFSPTKKVQLEKKLYSLVSIALGIQSFVFLNWFYSQGGWWCSLFLKSPTWMNLKISSTIIESKHISSPVPLSDMLYSLSHLHHQQVSPSIISFPSLVFQ